GLRDRFSVVVASGEVGLAKPDPAIFALACERLEVQPKQAAHVGDRLDLDAQAAASAGMQGIWLDRLGASAQMETARQADPIRIVTLHELAAVLAG
ncbi:MAG TPA: HAD family hydrolase, partial [Solirubrobacteraceae bacterium]|nr:HAD family hydrolase [Solirubrobacteraceae bacterium]